MKTFLYSSLITICFCSCSPDSAEELSTPEATLKGMVSYKSITDPANPDNPFDYAGELGGTLQDQYYSNPADGKNAQAVHDTVIALAMGIPDFTNLLPQGYVFPVATEITTLIEDASEDFNNDLIAAGYTLLARNYLESLNDSLASLKQSDASYDQVYSYLTSIEADIIKSVLPAREKEALLITSSVLRYTFYSDTRKRRRDRDWEWSTGNITATSVGAMENIPEAIINALVSRSYQP